MTTTTSLDITRETCPMTFVRVRLALDRLAPGDLLEVLLSGEEPRRNVPRTAVEQGHAIVEQSEDASGITRLLLRRPFRHQIGRLFGA